MNLLIALFLLGFQKGETVVHVPSKIEPKTCPAPAYPEISRRRGEEGRVLLEAEVLETGRVGTIRVVQESRFPLLNRAATEAVQKWVLRPARRNGTAVADRIRIPVRFQLVQPGPRKR